MIIVVALCTGGCGPSTLSQAFDKAKWHNGRKSNPDLNSCPSMLDDLMTNHLSLGMRLEDVTNLLGSAEIRTPVGSGVRTQGEFIEQTVYVYKPGMHNGWMVQGTNSLVLYFGRNGEYLREWSPSLPIVQPVSVADSEGARDARASGRLHVGNLRFAGTPSQFETLLGHPDERRTENQLDYFLGKRSRRAWDEVFLELHFDESNRLSRITRSEH
ncbi:MAG TPA: hypothetical protein VNT99_16525 [Methylomirabilota bacterium]|nr:hypothetical protein [Methylomirabilota bacterium]